MTCSWTYYIFSVRTGDPFLNGWTVPEQIIYSPYELPTLYELFTSDQIIYYPYGWFAPRKNESLYEWLPVRRTYPCASWIMRYIVWINLLPQISKTAHQFIKCKSVIHDNDRRRSVLPSINHTPNHRWFLTTFICKKLSLVLI